jgi:pimeloyl-ACP methyl ester carboxylesterase
VAGATFVLVPGAGGAAWYWHRVAAELRGRGHQVVAVDLPTEDDSAGLVEYADTAVAAATGAAAGAADRDVPLVVVAQSMGGLIAPALARRLSASLVVLLNAMIPVPDELAGEWWENTGQPAARRELDLREGRSSSHRAADLDVATYFLHDLPPEVLEDAWANARGQSDTPFGRPGPDVSWPAVPIRVLTGRDDRFFPAEFQRRVARERLGLTVDEVPGGHCAALSYPVEVADRLEGYLAELGELAAGSSRS